VRLNTCSCASFLVSNPCAEYDVMDWTKQYTTEGFVFRYNNKKKTSLTIQYSSEGYAGDISGTYGNTKRDQFMLYLYGIDQVSWGKKNIIDCLHTADLGVLPVDDTYHDYTPCAGSEHLL